MIFNPNSYLKLVFGKDFFKGKILNSQLELKQLTLQSILKATNISKRDVDATVYKVADKYDEKMKRLKKEGVKAYKSEALNDEVLLKNRLENLVLWNEIQNIKEEHDGEYYRWLPSSAEEPDPEHQLLYGKIFKVGEGDKDGNMPSERYGCKCGLEILDEQAKVKLEERIYGPKTIEPEEAEVEPESGKLTINKDCNVYKKAGAEVYKGGIELLNEAGEAERALWRKYETELKIDTAYNQRGAYYSPLTGGISINIERDIKAHGAFAEHQVYFHELGHNMDYLAGDRTTRMPFSNEFEQGIFAKTIKQEIEEKVNIIDKELKQVFKEHKNDIEYLYKNKLVGDWEYSFYQKTGRLTRELKYNKQYAYSKLARKIRSLETLGASISDMAEGATSGKVRAGFGHGKSYWKDKSALGTEAFAEIYSASVTNKKELEVIREFLPKTISVYERMIKELTK
jgi:hypothetical protein